MDTKYSLSELAASRRLAELPGQAVDLQRHIKVVEARAEAAETAAIEAKAALAKAVLGAARAEAMAIEGQAQAKAELEHENQELRDALQKAQMMVSALEDRLEAHFQHSDPASEDLSRHGGEDGGDDLAEVLGSPAAVPSAATHAADPSVSPPILSAGTAGPRMASSSRPQRVLAPGRIALGVPAAILCAAVILFPSAGLIDFDARDASMTVDGGQVASLGAARTERRKPQNASVPRPVAVKPDAQRLNVATGTPVGMRVAAPRRESLRRTVTAATVSVSADRAPSGSWLLWMPIERQAIERAMRSMPSASSANPPNRPRRPNSPDMAQSALVAR